MAVATDELGHKVFAGHVYLYGAIRDDDLSPGNFCDAAVFNDHCNGGLRTLTGTVDNSGVGEDDRLLGGAGGGGEEADDYWEEGGN
jgi:hypothetical protein